MLNTNVVIRDNCVLAKGSLTTVFLLFVTLVLSETPSFAADPPELLPGVNASVLTQDRLLPVVLDEPINIRQSNIIKAHITQDIMGIDGQTVLLKKGDRIEGIYSLPRGDKNTRIGCVFRSLKRNGILLFSGASGFGSCVDEQGRTGLDTDKQPLAEGEAFSVQLTTDILIRNPENKK